MNENENTAAETGELTPAKYVELWLAQDLPVDRDWAYRDQVFEFASAVERAALAAHLAGQSQATRVVPDLHNAIMNLPCNYKGDLNFEVAYKTGHRDARHAAAELVNEFEAAQEVTQNYAESEPDDSELRTYRQALEIIGVRDCFDAAAVATAALVETGFWESTPAQEVTQQAAKSQVGCERDDGLLNIHAENETCEVCAPAAVEEVRNQGRKTILLQATRDLLQKQRDSGYVLNLLSQTVFYDDADCDGGCLLEDIEAELESDAEATQGTGAPSAQQAAKAETAEQAEGDQANVLPPTRGTDSLLNADELAALRRFNECALDGEGYDVSKEMMQRLAEIGVVRRKSGAYFEHTEYGLAVLDGTHQMDIGALVNSFLGWPLPASLHDDLGRIEKPIGTHLMNADEARAMFEFVLASRFRAQGGNTNDKGSDLAPTTSTVSAPGEIRNAALDEAANVCDRLRGGDSLEGAAYWDAAADECASCIRALRTASTATASGSTKASQAAASDAARNRAAEDADDTRRLDFLGGAAVVSMHQYEPSDGSPYIAIDLDLLGSPTVRGSTLRDAIDAAICALRTTSGKGEAA